MAIMLPLFVAEQTVSDAERGLFHRLRDELDDEWCVIHSLGMAVHPRKPWAEIDFVLIGAPGVFCLEVKGGRIARVDGQWTTTNRRGRTSPLRESPFAQVGSAAAALYKYMLKKFRRISDSVVGYGVMMPDCVFNIDGPDIESGVVYDASDVSLPLPEYVKRLATYWTTNSQQRWSRIPVELSCSECTQIRTALIQDFALRPSLRASMASLQDELIRYTSDQVATLQGLQANPRVLVRGGAGTGKTVLAAEETARLAGEGKRVLLTCFNRRLADHLKGRFSEDSQVTVETLHALLMSIVRDAGLQSRLPDASSDDLYQVFLPELCGEALLEGAVDIGFDAIVVDEGQDILLDTYVDVFDLLLTEGISGGQWRVFLDPNQDIFSGVSIAGLSRLLRARPTEYELTTNCRNGRPIAITSSILSRLPQPRVLRIEGGDADVVFVKDGQDMRRKVSEAIGQLRHQQVPADQIVVLSGRTLSRSSLRDGLVGGRCQLVERGEVHENAIRYATIASFKGLEADAVLVVDLPTIDTDDFRLAAYVASTRAHAFLLVFLPESERSSFRMLAQDFGKATRAASAAE